MTEYIIRFLAGGIVVSLFSMTGDVLRPKSFAGLLGAAPSIALVTLALTISAKGPGDAQLEAWSMIFGSVALGLYSAGVCLPDPPRPRVRPAGDGLHGPHRCSVQAGDGGLFLAFPAVFCASATLIEIHERDRKEMAGLPGTRPRAAGGGAGRDGRRPGSFGLLGFAALMWALPRFRAVLDPFRPS